MQREITKRPHSLHMHRYQKVQKKMFLEAWIRDQASPFSQMPSCQRNSRGKLVLLKKLSYFKAALLDPHSVYFLCELWFFMNNATLRRVKTKRHNN